MSKCKLEHYRVLKDPSVYRASEATLISKCTTHDWTFEGSPSLQCPIGRIEEAADKAIEKIREERVRAIPQLG